MSNDNIISFPEPPRLNARQPSEALNRRAEQLREQFVVKGRGQAEVFENLSRYVEKLVAEIKAKDGEKSGAMQKAFGPDLVRTKGRFSARNGIAPSVLCKTPATWIRVLNGFAAVMRTSQSQMLISALGDAMGQSRQDLGFGQDIWLAELDGLLGPMCARLEQIADLPAITDYIARSGFYPADGKLAVSEWPSEPWIEPDGLYNPNALDLIPHVLGLNYEPVAEVELDLREATSDAPIWNLLASLHLPAAELEEAVSVELWEGTRIALAFAVRSDTGRPDLAIVEWQIALARLTDRAGIVSSLKAAGGILPLPAQFNTVPGASWEPSEQEARQRPFDWTPNSLRFHFRGTDGFDRIAVSLIVAPWVYGDPDGHDSLMPPGLGDAEAYPVACPRHTVAGAIEANLLYADDMGGGENRIDRLLEAGIRRTQDLLSAQREPGEARRQHNKQMRLNEWQPKPEANGMPLK